MNSKLRIPLCWKAIIAGREFDVGYIRAPGQPELNRYGTTLSDLFSIIREAPEVRRCLVRRLAEHLLGAGHVLDPGWLEWLTDGFDERLRREGSTSALRETLKRIVLGNTFAEPDPLPSECYDRAPGERAEGPPCSVRFLFQRNCGACHGPSAPAAGLDLTSWREVGGVSTFTHRVGGVQVSPSKTFAALAERLNTPDDARRMPPGSAMPATDRARLYLWVDSIRATLGGP